MKPEIDEVAQGIFRVKIPLPRNPLKTINSYIIPDEEKTLVVDLGFNLPECQDALYSALKELGRPWSSVQVLVTHSHPDHIGLLDVLPATEHSVLAGFASLAEVAELRSAENLIREPLAKQMKSDLASGALTQSTKSLADIRSSSVLTEESALVDLPPEYTSPTVVRETEKLVEGDVVAVGSYHFEVMHTPGHDDWHLCLYDKAKGIILVGDHVLRRITPTIASWNPAQDNLDLYIRNLIRMPREEGLVALPAHGKPISSLGAEADRIIAHHKARLGEFKSLVEKGYDNVATIAANAEWRYDDWYNWHVTQQFFSIGETFAHLFRLANEGFVDILPDERYAFRFVPRQ